MRIAIVDLGPYLAGEKGALERAALEIAAACGSLGFFFVKNHGVPASLVERVFRETARFHALPLERKMQVRVLTGDPPRHAPQSFGEFLAEINRSNIDLSPEKSS
jgi:isopenicillin N synthase-like dioxygenase